MCCANRNRLLEQGSNSLFLYDLCQTVYLSPQICIPAGDVDACLSMECCVSVFFRLLSKTHFSHGTIFALWREQVNLQIDTDICSMYEYFEIFLQRMLMCRGAADMLGATFKLTANGAKVL